MTQKYFTLQHDGPGSTPLKFGVIQGGYFPRTIKKSSEETTLNGEWDISVGGIYRRHEYVIRVRETEDRDGYGTKDDLATLFELNSPNGIPSNILQFIDHYGQGFTVMMVGDHLPEPLSVILEGLVSYWNIRINLVILNAIGS